MQIQLTDPNDRPLATTTETSRSTVTYTTRALIDSFRREHVGVYTCTATLSSPRLQKSVISTTSHQIYIGKILPVLAIM
jgi:hypothetical protein